MSVEPPALLEGEEPLAAQVEPTSLRFASALGLREAGAVVYGALLWLCGELGGSPVAGLRAGTSSS